jgi:hypothetical protein
VACWVGFLLKGSGLTVGHRLPGIHCQVNPGSRLQALGDPGLGGLFAVSC